MCSCDSRERIVQQLLMGQVSMSYATLQPRGKRSFWVCSEIMRVRAPFDRASGVWAVFMPNTDFSRLADTYREEVK